MAPSAEVAADMVPKAEAAADMVRILRPAGMDCTADTPVAQLRGQPVRGCHLLARRQYRQLCPRPRRAGQWQQHAMLLPRSAGCTM